MPYASLRYWISFVSLAFGSAICLDASLFGYEPVAYPIGTLRTMSSWDDDDDWTGTPPEGHHSASRANPGFWAEQRAPLSITGAGIGIALIILVIVWLL